VKRSIPLLVAVAGACVALDQWTKHWATTALAGHPPVRIVGDFVRLTYARNSGIAFSLLAGRGLPLYVFSIVAAIVVFALFLRQERLPFARQLALALILGGAVGNLIDRVSTGLVVDFILLSWGPHEFPVFNVADSAVTCGVVLFALAWSREPQSQAVDPAGTPDPARVESGSEADESDGGPAGAGAGSGTEGGPLAGQGADRPLA
jgi:signal peptidase II